MKIRVPNVSVLLASGTQIYGLIHIISWKKLADFRSQSAEKRGARLPGYYDRTDMNSPPPPNTYQTSDLDWPGEQSTGQGGTS